MGVVFKVVTRLEDGSLKSAFCSRRHTVIYPPGQTVRAKIGRLFAFADQAQAMKFVNLYSGPEMRWELWEAEGDDPVALSFMLAGFFSEPYSDREMTSWWRKIEKGESSVDPLTQSLTPAGTVVCKSIRLLVERASTMTV